MFHPSETAADGMDGAARVAYEKARAGRRMGNGDQDREKRICKETVGLN